MNLTVRKSISWCTILEKQLLIKLFLNLFNSKKLYLVKMCPIFDSSPPVFGAGYQSFLRVCRFLHIGISYFGYLSENLSNPTDINPDLCNYPPHTNANLFLISFLHF